MWDLKPSRAPTVQARAAGSEGVTTDFAMKKRLHIKFAGRVQGVGFRFTAEAIARQFNITGWARNLTNGEVEIVAEGEKESLEEFISNLQGQFSANIADKEISWNDPTSEFKEFGIRFY